MIRTSLDGGTAEQLAATERAERRRSASQWTTGVKRALFVVCVFFLFQQITGINVTFYYGPKIMSDILQGGSSGYTRSGPCAVPGDREPGERVAAVAMSAERIARSHREPIVAVAAAEHVDLAVESAAAMDHAHT